LFADLFSRYWEKYLNICFHFLSSQGIEELKTLTVLEATCFLAFNVHALWVF